VADTNDSQVVHLSAAGVELWRGGAFDRPYSLSVNPTDGSCWVADTHNDQVVHLSAGGTELWRGGGFYHPSDSPSASVSVNPVDGSCWVADHDSNRVVHLAASGAELWQGGGFQGPDSVSVNSTDGSCWVADTNDSQVVHLSAAGVELWRGGAFDRPYSLSVNPVDGSCWAADQGVYDAASHSYVGSSVVHLSAGGVELWRGAGFNGAQSVSVNPTDGSCWVADWGNEQVVHVSAAGVELWRGGGFDWPPSVSVNPTDGSCWVAGSYDVRHLSASGEELWRGAGFDDPWSVSVDSTDGSCWAADTWNSQVVHLVVLGDVFRDVNRYYWAYNEIETCAAAGIVQGYSDDTYRPSLPVTRDQMAVYISRALVTPSGDAAIPDPEPPPSFSDVATDHWAYKWIEYAVSHDVVQGYPGGTYHPDEAVSRGQMAVYVARAVAGGDAAVPADTDGATFTDVTDANDWAWCYRYVEYCADEGIVQGYADSTYRPADAVTRDQMAVYVARAFGLPM
jgi:DNA-binding beta-propeller fold protein YncE